MASNTFVNNVGLTLIKTDIVSSTIKTATDLNVFQSVGGGFIIDDIVVVTNATGIAGGTALVFKADGIVFFQTAISALGASSVKDMKNASVTGTKIIVPEGAKYITVNSTVADCTGAGVVSVALSLRKLDSNSAINLV